MKARYQAVLFDLDGTLTESHPGVVNTVSAVLKDMGIPVPEENILRRFIGPPLHYSFQKYCGMTLEQCEEGVIRFREIYNVKGLYENSVFPGIHDLLRDLRAGGAKTIVATAKAQSAADAIIRHFELAPLVDFVSGAEEAQRKQSKSVLIQKGLDLYRISPEHAVMIGDTRFDVDGANGAGTDFIGVLFGYGTREEMETEGGKKFAATVAELHSMLLED